jgi:hypothetical protein
MMANDPNELIGVTSVPRDFRKRLLIFDRIAFPNARQFVGDVRSAEGAARFKTFLWLRERGLLFEQVSGIPRRVSSSDARVVTASMRREGLGRFESPLYGSINEKQGERLDGHARVWALEMRESFGLNAVPMALTWRPVPLGIRGHLPPPDVPLTKADVLEVVIKQIPTPGEAHSLEDIVAFREVARSQGLVQALRASIYDLARGSADPFEVSERIADLMSRYERALSIEKMSRDTGVLETIVVSTAEVAEALVKFKWATAAKKLFEVRHKRIDLMKAQLTLPGREVAYIVKAREEFGR